MAPHRSIASSAASSVPRHDVVEEQVVIRQDQVVLEVGPIQQG